MVNTRTLDARHSILFVSSNPCEERKAYRVAVGTRKSQREMIDIEVPGQADTSSPTASLRASIAGGIGSIAAETIKIAFSTAIEVAASSSELKAEGDDVPISSSPPIDDAQRCDEKDLVTGHNGHSNTNLLVTTIQDESTAEDVGTQKGLTSIGPIATVQLTSAKSHTAIGEESTAGHEDATNECPPITVAAVEKESASPPIDDAQRHDEKDRGLGHGENSNTNELVKTIQDESTGEDVGTQKNLTGAGPTATAQSTSAKSYTVDRQNRTAGHQETIHENPPIAVVAEEKDSASTTADRAARKVSPLSPLPRTSDGGSPSGMIGVDPTDSEASSDVHVTVAAVVGRSDLLGDNEGEALHSLQGLRRGSRRDEGMNEGTTEGGDHEHSIAGGKDGRSLAGHQESEQPNIPVTAVLEDTATIGERLAHAYRAPRNADSHMSGGDKPGHHSPLRAGKGGNVGADGDEKPPPAVECQSAGHNSGRIEGDGHDELEGGRVVHVSRAGESETVWFAGQREAADVKVVERLTPSYQLVFSVEVALRNTHHREQAPDKAEGLQLASASICLGKSEIKEALMRWIDIVADGAGGTSLGATGGNGGAAADAALRRWISGGRVPRRAHLLRWLLWRLKLIEVQGGRAGAGPSPRDSAFRGYGRIWSLVLFNPVGVGDSAAGGREDAENDGHEKGVRYVDVEGLNVKNKREQRGDAQGRRLLSMSRQGREWWNSEGWERESTLTTNTSDGSSFAIPPPDYSEPCRLASVGAATPPPYETLVNSSRLQSEQRDSMQGTEARTHVFLTAHAAAPSDTASRQTLPPPYHSRSSESATSNPAAVTPMFRKSAETETRKMRSESRDGSPDRGTPPPPYRSLVVSPRETDCNSYWHTTPVVPTRRNGGRTDFPVFSHHDDENEIERERECGRERGRRRRVSETYQPVCDTEARPETAERMTSSTWGEKRGVVRAEDAMPGTPLSSPEKQPNSQNVASCSVLRGLESWDYDRWRLTAHLNSCKKKLAEAEERRRRAEAAAAVAERTARSTVIKDGTDEREKRARVRAATQRVLDLMLVAERVRQKHQRMRVASARANELAARLKQPFRERRGRSQKGPSLGPLVPPVDAFEGPRDPRVESAMQKFCWNEHGRRYRRDVHGSGEVDLAMETVRKVAAACLVEGTDFRQPFLSLDADGDGRLTLAELGAALKRVSVPLRLSQVTTLFRHFDPAGHDTISRREFLWSFVDKPRLLALWRNARGERDVEWTRVAPFRDRADPPGSGTLSRVEFVRALREVPILVSGWETETLLDRFESSEDGNINWREFVSFMCEYEQEEQRDRDNRRQQQKRYAVHHDHNKPKDEPPEDYARFLTKGSGDVHWESARLGGSSSGRQPRRTGGIASPHLPRGEVGRNRFQGGLFDRGNRRKSFGPTAGSALAEVRAATAPEAKPRQRLRNINRTWAKNAPTDESGGGRAAGWRSKAAEAGVGASKILDTTAALRVLDELLDDQRELEAFLEEEFARRGLAPGSHC